MIVLRRAKSRTATEPALTLVVVAVQVSLVVQVVPRSTPAECLPMTSNLPLAWALRKRIVRRRGERHELPRPGQLDQHRPGDDRRVARLAGHRCRTAALGADPGPYHARGLLIGDVEIAAWPERDRLRRDGQRAHAVVAGDEVAGAVVSLDTAIGRVGDPDVARGVDRRVLRAAQLTRPGPRAQPPAADEGSGRGELGDLVAVAVDAVDVAHAVGRHVDESRELVVGRSRPAELHAVVGH